MIHTPSHGVDSRTSFAGELLDPIFEALGLEKTNVAHIDISPFQITVTEYVTNDKGGKFVIVDEGSPNYGELATREVIARIRWGK